MVLISIVAGTVLAWGAAEPAAGKAAPVEARLAAAQAVVKAKPDSAAAYNDLAAAYCRKGRDTEDVAVYEQAEAAVERSLQLSKANYEARKLQVAILLGKHEFAQALRLATELNRKVPDDLMGWAALVDANMALGNYAAAERQAQWVLDLRPGNTLGFEKAAQLREVFGDVAGAIEFWDEANRRTSANDRDQKAYYLTQKARLQLSAGYDKEAEGVLGEALQLFPESQRALEVMARIRTAQGKFGEAALLLGKRYRAVASAGNLYDWAEALDRAGETGEAKGAFERFARQAEAEAGKPFNANVQLVYFDLERKHDASAAVQLAAKMSAERHDCETLAAYGWALYADGRYAEAKTQMDLALGVGVRDPVYFCRAAQIAKKAGDAAAASAYDKELATFKGVSCEAIATLVKKAGA